MNRLIEHLKRDALLRGIVYTIIGIATVYRPASVFNLAVYAISGYLALMGLFYLLAGIKNKRLSGSYDSHFIMGVFLLIGAVAVLALTRIILGMLPVTLGLLVTVYGVSRILRALDLRQYVNVNWVLFLVYGIALVLGGLFLLFNPFRSILLFFRLFGAVLIFMGVSECLSYLRLRNIDR